MQKQGNTEKYENDKYHKLHHDRTFPSITRCLLLDWLLRLRQGSALPQPEARQVYVYNYLYICLVYVQIHRLKDRHKAYLYKRLSIPQCWATQVSKLSSACACVQNYYKYGLICMCINKGTNTCNPNWTRRKYTEDFRAQDSALP